jgi:hypothetical protein
MKWREDKRDTWSIRGNWVGTLRRRATLFVRIPSVVQVCRKISGKLPAFEIYVLLPPARTPGKGNIIMLNSLKGLEDLCYSVGDLAMFVPEANLEGVDIVKKWHDYTKFPRDGPRRGDGAAGAVRHQTRQRASRRGRVRACHRLGSRSRRPWSRSRGLRPRGERRRAEAQARPRYGPLPRRAPLQWHTWSPSLRKSRV